MTKALSKMKQLFIDYASPEFFSQAVRELHVGIQNAYHVEILTVKS
jgi:hypothetical protein